MSYITEIEQRLSRASASDWYADTPYQIHDPNAVTVQPIRGERGNALVCEVRYPFVQENKANIEFITHAKTDIRYLLGKVKWLEEKLEELNNSA